jgi:hypothetical protein
MTLRDYFAGQALNAMVGATNRFMMDHGENAVSPSNFAELAYIYADAMLEVRGAA